MKEEMLPELIMNSEGGAKYSGDYKGFLLLVIGSPNKILSI